MGGSKKRVLVGGWIVVWIAVWSIISSNIFGKLRLPQKFLPFLGRLSGIEFCQKETWLCVKFLMIKMIYLVFSTVRIWKLHTIFLSRVLVASVFGNMFTSGWGLGYHYLLRSGSPIDSTRVFLLGKNVGKEGWFCGM